MPLRVVQCGGEAADDEACGGLGDSSVREERRGVGSKRARQVAKHGDTYDVRTDVALERDLVSQGRETVCHVGDSVVDEPRESVFCDGFNGDFGREISAGLMKVLPSYVRARDVDGKGLRDARSGGVHSFHDERLDDVREHALLLERLPDCSNNVSGRDVVEYAVGGPCYVRLERSHDLGVGHLSVAVEVQHEATGHAGSGEWLPCAEHAHQNSERSDVCGVA